MTNRQLIKILLDEPMDAEVMLNYPKKHFDKNSGEVLGYMFEITAVGHFSGITTIEFIDWRDKGEEK